MQRRFFLQGTAGILLAQISFCLAGPARAATVARSSSRVRPGDPAWPSFKEPLAFHLQLIFSLSGFGWFRAAFLGASRNPHRYLFLTLTIATAKTIFEPDQTVSPAH